MQEKEKAWLSEIIEKLNALFGEGTTDQDQLSFVQTLRGKMLESEKLRQWAANNTKEQFASSPDLNAEFMNAIMNVLDAHTAMSTKALNSAECSAGSKTFCSMIRACGKSCAACRPPEAAEVGMGKSSTKKRVSASSRHASFRPCDGR